MALEITNGKSPYSYRISPNDARQIDRRENRHGARWQAHTHCDSATEAKIALLKLERGRKANANAA